MKTATTSWLISLGLLLALEAGAQSISSLASTNAIKSTDEVIVNVKTATGYSTRRMSVGGLSTLGEWASAARSQPLWMTVPFREADWAGGAGTEERFYAAYSRDLTNWFWGNSTNYIFADPDARSNNYSGPEARNSCVIRSDDGYWYLAYNNNERSTNANLDNLRVRILKSSDLLNWSVQTDIFPTPTNGPAGQQVFAPHWFRAPDGKVYLLTPYGTNLTASLSCLLYQTRATAADMTTWAAPVVVGTNIVFDAAAIHDGSKYCIYIQSTSGILKKLTNSIMTSMFQLETGAAVPGNNLKATEGIEVRALPDGRWCAFAENLDNATLSLSYSSDLGATWTAWINRLPGWRAGGVVLVGPNDGSVQGKLMTPLEASATGSAVPVIKTSNGNSILYDNTQLRFILNDGMVFNIAPIADGSLITNLSAAAFPSVFSNSFKIDAAHALSLSNATASSLAKIGADKTVTNYTVGEALPVLNGDGVTNVHALRLTNGSGVATVIRSLAGNALRYDADVDQFLFDSGATFLQAPRLDASLATNFNQTVFTNAYEWLREDVIKRDGVFTLLTLASPSPSPEFAYGMSASASAATCEIPVPTWVTQAVATCYLQSGLTPGYNWTNQFAGWYYTPAARITPAASTLTVNVSTNATAFTWTNTWPVTNVIAKTIRLDFLAASNAATRYLLTPIFLRYK